MDRKEMALKKELCAIDLDKVRNPVVDLTRIRYKSMKLLQEEMGHAFCEGLKKIIYAIGTEGKDNIVISIFQPEMVQLMGILSVYKLGVESYLLTEEGKSVCNFVIIDSGFYGSGKSASAEIRLEIHRTSKEEYFSNR